MLIRESNRDPPLSKENSTNENPIIAIFFSKGPGYYLDLLLAIFVEGELLELFERSGWLISCNCYYYS